jgi:hypothetical protein
MFSKSLSASGVSRYSAILSSLRLATGLSENLTDRACTNALLFSPLNTGIKERDQLNQSGVFIGLVPKRALQQKVFEALAF